MQNKPVEVKKLLRYQVLFTLLITCILFPLGLDKAISGFLGGAVVIFAGFIMYLMIFKNYRAQDTGKLVARFYSAEIAKLIITMACFALIVLNVRPLNFPTLIIVFFIIQVVPALFLAALNRGNNG